MSITGTYLKRPYLITSLIFLLSAIGLIGFRHMPITLFPDSDYPQIAIVVFYPGASAKDVEDQVTRLVEKEANTIDQVRKVFSSTKDEITAITAEFEYTKGLEAAATDVSNALKKIEGQLPKDIRPPQLFKISKATQPDLILAVSPKEGASYDLARTRQLADNELKEVLLRIPEVANVEVFGGYNPELTIVIDANRLNSYGINLPQVLTAVASQNLNIPNGYVIRSENQFILKTQGELSRKDEAENMVIAHLSSGDVHLRDVAEVRTGYQERQSLYHGNGRPAIGISILRSHSGHDIDTIDAVEKALPALKAKYSMLEFEIADTQKELIEKSVNNMIDALRDAIIMTVLVIFLFLADVRGMLLATISIPFTYLLTFAIMYMLGMEFNMVTLTGIILAVGMLLDDAIVVLENIERRYHQKVEDLRTAVFGGTDEVMLAIFSGTYATVMVLLPIIFIGGFVQTILRPLSLTLCLALAVSYVVSVTVIPLFAPLILKAEAKKNRFERIVQLFDKYCISPIRDFFVNSLTVALRHRAVFLILAVLVLLASMRQMPLVGRDLMPPMDTGIFKINFEMDSNTSLAETERILNEMEAVIKRLPGVVRMSTVAGSEPGVISFGSGRIPQQGQITVHLVDRFHRNKTLWQVEDELRKGFRGIPGLKYVDVFDYGATALSSIKATVDILISGPDAQVIDEIGDEVMTRLRGVKGLESIARSWTLDKRELAFKVDMEKAAIYGMSPVTISQQVATAVRGGVVSVFRVPGQDGYAIRVQYGPEFRDSIPAIETMLIQTPKGLVPLRELGGISVIRAQTTLTRQYLQPTLDIYGYRGLTAVSHIHEDIDKVLSGLKLPPGYTITHEGDLKQMKESFGRLLAALAIGLILLYFSLVPAFDSWIHPLTIMSAIPLGLIGAVWSMLIAGKHQCMPSFMGMILLAGIVVKNSILLIDFIQEARKQGMDVRTAIVESVRIRTRPILMTAVGTSVGMIPIALEWAIGLERLSPLAVVAIGGLMVSTFLTLIYVPILYSLFEDVAMKVKKM